MKRPSLYLAWIIFPALCTISFGQATSVEQYLAKMNASYENSRVEVIESDRAKRTQLAKQYVQGLNGLESKYKQSGTLEPLLAVRNERERFIKEKSMGDIREPKNAPELAKAMSGYARLFDDAKQAYSQDVYALVTKFDQSLQNLQSKYTQVDKIEEALQVKARRDELAGLDYVVEAKTIAEQSQTDRKALARERAQHQRENAAAKPAPGQPANQFKGSDKKRIADRYEVFIDSLAKEELEEAVTVIDPQQVESSGKIAILTIFKAFAPMIKLADKMGVDFRTGDITFAEDAMTAVQIPENKPSEKDKKEKPVNWIKYEGEWYIRL